jgi:hypothetical protein
LKQIRLPRVVLPDKARYAIGNRDIETAKVPKVFDEDSADKHERSEPFGARFVFQLRPEILGNSKSTKCRHRY